ncbi:MAG: small, acid-soluble spore protein, alpha/beta type [Chloroflexota bacterium]
MAGDREEKKMDRLEEEVKKEVGVEEKPGKEMTTSEAGKIGGHMVKHLIEEGKEKEGEGHKEGGER